MRTCAIGMDTVVEPFAQILGQDHHRRELPHRRVLHRAGFRARGRRGDRPVHDGEHLARWSAARTAGPFARLRMENHVEAGAHIGNFVELKKTRLGAGAKANHLAYLGDSQIGARSQHRRRHHHLQLRWLPQAPHADRRRRVHRQQFDAGGADRNRRRRVCGRRVGDHRSGAGRRPGAGPGAADPERGLGGQTAGARERRRPSRSMLFRAPDVTFLRVADLTGRSRWNRREIRAITTRPHATCHPMPSTIR